MRIEHLTPAEPGWKAVFAEPDGTESVSRVLGWAVVAEHDDGELTGVIVDPSDPARIVPAAEATSPAGGTFFRYRYVAPDPIVITPPPPPPAAPEQEGDPAEQVAKTLLKRRR